MNKILCNKCMQEMVTVDYPCGKYVEPCECTKDVDYKTAYNEGYKDGYDDAEDSIPRKLNL